MGFQFRDEFTTTRAPIATGSVTLANTRLSLVAGTAFVDFSEANVLTDHVGKYLRVTDAAGKSAWGYIKAAGTGETLGDELVVNGDFSSATGWILSTGVTIGGDILTVDGSGAAWSRVADRIMADSTGKLLKASITILSRTAGSITIRAGSVDFGTFSTAATHTAYGVPTTSYSYYIKNGSTAFAGTIDDASMKQVLTPSNTGVTIVSTRGGTTYNWASIETGFNYNDAAGYSWAIYDDATQVLNGSAAEPGVGTRTVVDTENKLSIANGALTFSGGKATPEISDPSVRFPTVARAAGRMLISDFTVGTVGLAQIGFDVNTSGTVSNGLYIFSGSVLQTTDAATALGAYTATSNYQVAVPLRATGNFVFVKGGTEYPSWRLLWISGTGNDTPLYPTINGRTAVFTSSFLRIPSTLWLPSPLISDGFSAWGVSDGKGHQEETGLGSGGSGKTWSGTTWSVSGAKAINTPVAGTSLVDANASTFEAAGGIYGWTKYGNNTVENDSNTLKITYVDNSLGALEPFTDAKDLTSDLTVGTWYQVSYDAKVNAGSNVRPAVGDGVGVTYLGKEVTSTDFVTNIITFRGAHATNGGLWTANMGAGEIIWLDNWTLKPLVLSELISTVETSTRDVIATVAISTTPAGTQAGLAVGIDSATDPKYGIFAYHDGTNAKLDKLVNGVWTNVISADVTFSANAEIRVIRDGTSFRLYYDNVQVGSTSTVADVGDYTLHGLFSTYTTPMDNFTVYARGSNGEYDSKLNALMSTSTGGGFGFGFCFGFGF